MRRGLAIVAATAAGLACWQVAAPPPVAARAVVEAQQKPNPLLLPRALDLYLKGEFDEANRRVISASGFTIEGAQRWIDSGSRESLPRRRLAAATCALEYAALRRYLIPSLVVWARALLANSQGPTPNEALWLRASVALSEGLGQWAFLTTGVVTQTGKPVKPGAPAPAAISHLAYAQQRFPDDPYFRMARVVAAEFLTSPDTIEKASRSDRGVAFFDDFGGDANDPAADRNSSEARMLEGAAETAEELLQSEPLRAEAHLRLGYIKLRLGDRDAALKHLDAVVAMEPRPELRYLGHLYAGLALARVNRASEAVASYRAALRFVPRARSATTLLTAVLLLSGRITEAEELTGDFLSQPLARSDPWETYFHGDYIHFGDIIGRLRAALQ